MPHNGWEAPKSEFPNSLSLAVYQYLKQCFDTLNAEAAEHGMAVFAEHTADARNRPGAHPNVDRLLEIAAGGAPLSMEVITSSR